MRALAFISLLLLGCGSRSSLLEAHGGRVAGDRAVTLEDGRQTSDARAGDGAGPYVDQVIRACVVAASCGGGSASGCIDDFAKLGWPQFGLFTGSSRALAERLLKCTQGEVHCSTFTACFGGPWVSLSLCREGGHCEGSRIVGKSNLSFDCGVLGWYCVGLTTGAERACCSQSPGLCAGGSGCSSATAGSTCQFNVDFNYECGAGQVCTTDNDLLCAGTGDSCQVGAYPTCQGGTTTYCAAGHLATHDCTQSPLRSACAATSASPLCVPAGSECGPEFAGECQNLDLIVCVDGHRRAVSCKALGFEACLSGAGKPYCGFYL